MCRLLNCQAARDEAVAASETAREAEIEVKALRTMTHRMILTQEEMVCNDFHFNHVYNCSRGVEQWT